MAYFPICKMRSISSLPTRFVYAVNDIEANIEAETTAHHKYTMHLNCSGAENIFHTPGAARVHHFSFLAPKKKISIAFPLHLKNCHTDYRRNCLAVY